MLLSGDGGEAPYCVICCVGSGVGKRGGAFYSSVLFFKWNLRGVHEVGDEVAGLPGGEGVEKTFGHDGVGELGGLFDITFFESGFLGEAVEGEGAVVC